MPKRWTPKEDKYLAENWGRRPFEKIAKHLNRTAIAVELRGKRIGLGPTRTAEQYVNANQLAKACGVDLHAVTDYWIAKFGLKAKRKITRHKQKPWQIDIEDFWQWAAQHKEVVNFARIEKDALAPEPDWVGLERKRDYKEIPSKQSQNWTPGEDAKLIALFNQGKPYKEIAKLMSRSCGSCERRIYRLKEKNTLRARKIQLPWSQQETEMMLQMEMQGMKDNEIAYELGREPDHIRDHRRNLRDKGVYDSLRWGLAVKEG